MNRSTRVVPPFLITALGFVIWMLPSTAAAQACPGDCNSDGFVTVDEIVVAVNIALGIAPVTQCSAADADANMQVSVDEIIASINNALNGCPPDQFPEDWEEAFDASEFGWVMSGWGPGNGELWVVGGRLLEGRILHYRAGTWSEVDTPFSVRLLNWVHGTSGSDVFVGGNGGVILHFDGEEWELQETPVSTPVWGIWATAPDDVWAVGEDNSTGGLPFIMRYDGVSWSLADLPPIVRPRVQAFFKVWGSGADDIYTVGQNGIVMHYDGSTFAEMGVGISQDLIGVWGTGPDDVTVVGGRGTAELAHFDGVEWMRIPQSPRPGLNGVWTRRDDVVHSVGVAGTVLRVDPRTPEVIAEEPVPTTLDLHAVFGGAGGAIYAFGANFEVPERGVVLVRRLRADD